MKSRRRQLHAAVAAFIAVTLVACALIQTSRSTAKPLRLLSVSVPVFYSLDAQPPEEEEIGPPEVEEIGPDGWVGPLFARRKMNPELQERQDRSIEMIQKWMQNSGDLTGDYEADNRRFAKMAAQMAVADQEEAQRNETRDWEEVEDPTQFRWISSARQWAMAEAAEAHRNDTEAFHEWEEENPKAYPEALIFPEEQYPTVDRGGWAGESDFNT